MPKLVSRAIVVTGLLLVTATCMQAQTGCADSPENPTVVFGIITAAASYGIMRFRNRRGSR